MHRRKPVRMSDCNLCFVAGLPRAYYLTLSHGNTDVATMLSCIGLMLSTGSRCTGLTLFRAPWYILYRTYVVLPKLLRWTDTLSQ